MVMAYIPRSSFIPKEASGAIPMQVQKKRTVRIFSLLASALLITSVASAIGAFLYKDYALGQLETAKAELQTVSAESNNEDNIAEIRTYDQKLKIAKSLLDNHIAPSRIFAELESTTKENVQFDAFELTYDPGFEVELKLGGNTRELSAIALQNTQFAKEGIFSDFKIEDINAPIINTLSTDPEVVTNTDVTNTFTVTALFNKRNIAYEGRNTPTSPVDTAVTSNPLDPLGAEGNPPITSPIIP